MALKPLRLELLIRPALQGMQELNQEAIHWDGFYRHKLPVHFKDFDKDHWEYVSRLINHGLLLNATKIFEAGGEVYKVLLREKVIEKRKNTASFMDFQTPQRIYKRSEGRYHSSFNPVSFDVIFGSMGWDGLVGWENGHRIKRLA